MVGGSSFKKSQFNLAVQGERQPGSAFKPFVLASALAQGISPDTRFDSKPRSINLGDKLWSIANYEGSYLGDIDLREATNDSDNTVYAQLTQQVGSQNVAGPRSGSGSRASSNAYFAIGLGAEAVNPLEMARAYDVRKRRGSDRRHGASATSPRAVPSVQDGNVVDDQRPASSARCSTPNDAGAPHVDAPERRHRRHGAARGPSRPPVAGKTGTTENHGDAWFVGYTPQLAVAVWVGYPNKLGRCSPSSRRRSGRGRHVPRADLEGVHGESRCAPERARSPSRCPSSAVRRRTRSSPGRPVGCSTTASARTCTRSCTSPAWGRARQRRASRMRSTSPASSAHALDQAEERLGMPLTPEVIYSPPRRWSAPASSSTRFPKRAIALVLGRPSSSSLESQHGAIPDLVGPARRARRKLNGSSSIPSWKSRGWNGRRWAGPQLQHAAVAPAWAGRPRRRRQAGRLAVAGDRSESRLRNATRRGVPPRLLDRALIPTRTPARRRLALGRVGARTAARRARAVELTRNAERLTEAARPGGEKPFVFEPAPPAHHLDALGRLERADEHAAASPSGSHTRLRHQCTP